MDLLQLRVFQGHLRDQCIFAMMSVEVINASLEKHNMDGIWFGLQNFLTSSANIAKMLWGSGGKHTEARRLLRESVGIDDNSPFRDVSMRNHFEHMDERIDRWWAQSSKREFVDRNIGNNSAISGPEPIDRFRMFNPETTEITFWGEVFNVQDIVNEIVRILPAVEHQAAAPLCNE